MTKQRWRSTAFMTIVCLGSALASCSPRAKADPRAGTWVMTVSHRPFVVLALHERSGRWTGTMSMPDHWSFSNDGLIYSEVGPGAKSRDITRITPEEGRLHLVFENPKDKTDTDEFGATLVDDSHLSLAMLDAPIKVAPWRLTRSSSAVTVPNDWNPEESYAADLPSGSSSSKMHAMFEADQLVRQGGPNVDFGAIAPEDAKRRAATRELIASNELHTGRDFREAAFIFQHGDRPDDYLLAHTLALVALAKGDVEARWIAAASLDRYLHAIRQPEILGTQFETKNGQPQPVKPFNENLVTDELRRALGVPALAEQLEQFKAVAGGAQK